MQRLTFIKNSCIIATCYFCWFSSIQMWLLWVVHSKVKWAPCIRTMHTGLRVCLECIQDCRATDREWRFLKDKELLFTRSLPIHPNAAASSFLQDTHYLQCWWHITMGSAIKRTKESCTTVYETFCAIVHLVVCSNHARRGSTASVNDQRVCTARGEKCFEHNELQWSSRSPKG